MGLLQQELENLQKTKYEMAQSYETQLQALKSQVRKMSVSLFCDCSIKNLYMPDCIYVPLWIWEGWIMSYR